MKSGGDIRILTNKYCTDVTGPSNTERCKAAFETKDPCRGKPEACYQAVDQYYQGKVNEIDRTDFAIKRRVAYTKLAAGDYDRELAGIASQTAQAIEPPAKPDVRTQLTPAAKAELEKVELLCSIGGTQEACLERLTSALDQLKVQYGEKVEQLSRVIQYDSQPFNAPIELMDVNGTKVNVPNMAAVKQVIAGVVGDFVVTGTVAKATAEELKGLCSEKIMTDPGNKTCETNIRSIRMQILQASARNARAVEQILSNPGKPYPGLVYKLTIDDKEEIFDTLTKVMDRLRVVYGVEPWSIRAGYFLGSKMGATDGGDSVAQSTNDNFNGHPNIHLSARKNFRLRSNSWWSAGLDLNFSRIRLEGRSVAVQEARPWMFSFGPGFEYNHAVHHDWTVLVGGALLMSKATDGYNISTEGALTANYTHLTLQGTLAGRYRINRGNAIIAGLKLAVGTSVVPRDLEKFERDPGFEPRQDYIGYGPSIGGFLQYEW